MNSVLSFAPANVGQDAAGPVLCGLILAGGEGQRLKPFIRRLRGDSLPKQYVKFTGAHSMIEHTFRRAERLIPRERVFTVVHESHLRYGAAADQLSRRHPGTVVAQPQNKDTGPGVLLPLLYIHKRYPNAVVAVFPSDQFVREEDHLMRHVRLACVIVKRQPCKMVMLGMNPEYEEPEYGYILPSANCDTSGWGTFHVGHFIEKPGSARAHDLIARGALWNTMLMVFHAGALLRWVGELRPDVYRHFERIRAVIGTSRETTVLREVYNRLETVNFSKDLLEPLVRRGSDSVAVLPVSGVAWSDWGSERRIVDTLKTMGRVPAPAPRPQNRVPRPKDRNAPRPRTGEPTR